MNYGWARGAAALAMVALLAGPLAACDRAPAAPDETAAQNLRAAEFFLTSNAEVEGVRTLPSGVQYKIIRSGPAGSVSPDRNDLVRVDYEGTLTDGTVFDSTRAGSPACFNLGNTVAGFRFGIGGVTVTGTEGNTVIPPMRLGGSRTIRIPSNLGYGPVSRTGIPSCSALNFDIQLVDAPNGC